VSGKISCTFLEVECLRVGDQIFWKIRPFFGPFSALFFKIGQNSAAGLSGRSTFYSALFDLRGRTIGQLATQHWGTTPEKGGGGREGGTGFPPRQLANIWNCITVINKKKEV
jgi:hypothetical protein